MAIRVKVVDRGRKHLVLRWTDPETGAVREQTAGTGSRKKAERAAGKLDAALVEGRYAAPNRMTWEEVRGRFDDEKLTFSSKRTRESYATALDVFERTMRPRRISEIKAATISTYQSRLQKRGLRTATIASYSRQLKSFLRWAERVGYLAKAPYVAIPKTRGGKIMRGRPITTEEFERLLSQVGSVVGENVAESWRHYLRGMWVSGLRLTESLHLYWDRCDGLRVDLSGNRPMLQISAEFEKSRKDRIHPMAPEFAEFLQAVPETERHGPVFDPQGYNGERPRADWVAKKVSDMGRLAGVVVDERDGKRKFASLHDFRRAFGQRWAAKLLPQQLRELMRHESIDTTLKFYVGQDAERTADIVWAAYDEENRIATGAETGDNAAAVESVKTGRGQETASTPKEK